MRIGFFDSGIGGLTVLNEALRELPGEKFTYYADTEHVPYGTKTKEEVRDLIFQAVEAIVEQGVKALVIACNTATSITVNDLRKKYSFPIIGMEPAVKPAVELGGNGRVLVMATPLTLKEEKFQNLVARIDAEHVVDALPMPKLVDFAERYEFDSPSVLSYLEERVRSFNLKQYSTIVLGCTHFVYFKAAMKKVLPQHINLIDGNNGTVKRLKTLLPDPKIEEDFCMDSEQILFLNSGKRDLNGTRFKRYLEYLERSNI